MKQISLKIPFTFTHNFEPGTLVEIPVATPTYMLRRDLASHSSVAEYDASRKTVTTPLEYVWVIHDFLVRNKETPGNPVIKGGAKTSPVATTAFANAAQIAADASAPKGFTTLSVRFVDEPTVDEDFTTHEPSVAVTWHGALEVSWTQI